MKKPLVGIIMGSQSDLNLMNAAADILDEFGIPYEVTVISAHRAPKLIFDYASKVGCARLKSHYRRCRWGSSFARRHSRSDNTAGHWRAGQIS